MANISTKKTLNIKNAVVDIDDGKINLEIEDHGVYSLAELMQEFNGTSVAITVGALSEIE